MPTLETIDGRTLSVDVGGLGDLIRGILQGNRETQEREELLGLSRTAAGLPGVSGEQPTSEQATDAQLRIATLNPQLLENVQQIIDSGSQRRIELSRQTAEQTGKDAIFLKSIKDPVKRQREITRLAAKSQTEGRNIDHFITLSNASSEEQDLILEKQIITATDAGDLFKNELTKMEEAEAFTLSPGQVRFEDGTEIARVAETVADVGFEQPKFEAFKKADGSEVTLDINSAAGKAEAQRIVAEGGSVSKAAKDITAKQREAAAFGARLEQSGAVIDEIGEQFTDFFQTGAFPSAFQSADRQRFDQAKRNFTNAILRRESGAAISPSEFDSADLQYFPQVGDGAEVLAQKKQNRQTALAALQTEAGEAFTQLKENLPETTVNIQDTEMSVGSIVTNNRGQRGRVEQDGTITPL